MKYNKLFTILCATSLLMSSCGDDFLNTSPTETASEEDVQDAIKKDPEKIQGFVSGFYKNLFSPESRQAHDDFGLKALELATDMMGEDIAYRSSNFFTFDYELDNRESSYRRPTSTWQQLYAVISGTNTVIGMVKPKDQSQELGDTEKYMLGQSYTLRAYCYFWLINMYQQPYQWNKDKPGIPLYTEDAVILQRGTVADVYKQILSDIDTGYKYLKGMGIRNKAELNEFAAAAIYANILSFVNDYPNQWKEVAKYAEIATQGGTLMNEEELLSGLNDLRLSEVLWGADINNVNNTFYASFMSHMDPFAPGYGGEVGAYKMIASDLYNKIPDNDSRKKWFGVKLNEKDPLYQYGKYVQRKFMDVSTVGTGDVFSSDYIYLRTGEMYFVAAEALFMAGDEAGAKQQLQKVMETRIPGYTTKATGSALLDEIKLQKRIEMWGEGRRFFDMKRRAEALDRTKSDNHRDDVIKTMDANERRMIYMIPDKEINANKIEQNP